MFVSEVVVDRIPLNYGFLFIYFHCFINYY